MKTPIYLLGIIFLVASCKIKEKIPAKSSIEIDQGYFDVDFNPLSQKEEIDQSFFVEIFPLDAPEINKVCMDLISFDGRYEINNFSKSYFEEYYVSTYSKLRSSQERKEFQFRKQMAEFVFEKIEKREIPKKAGQDLIKKIFDKTSGTDGDVEIERLASDYSGQFNPYKVSSKYLSVFKVVFENKSNIPKTIKLENFIINSGPEQLYPFKINYFESLYSNQQDLLRLIYRLNFPDELIVPPGEVVEKYFSIPALNINTQKISVRYLNESISSNFPFEVNWKSFDDKIIFERFIFRGQEEYKLQPLRYYQVLVSPDGEVTTLQRNSIYIQKELKNQKFDLYSIITQTNGFSYAKIENFFPAQYTQNLVPLIFEPKIKFKRK